MPDQFYIPGMPENLQGILYTPHQNLAETKRLRGQHAGNPAMQARLSVDDRYWQGREMTRENPLAGLASLAGAVPYDAAKLAYFHGPQPVKKGLAKLTEKLFPGEGFNDKTTSRPSPDQYRGHVNGIVEGAYGLVRDKIGQGYRQGMGDQLADRLSKITAAVNYSPTLSTHLMPDGADFGGKRPNGVMSTGQQARSDLGRFAAQSVAAHAVNPVATSLKVLNNLVQTVAPDIDTRQQFEPWTPQDRMMGTLAPGYTGVKRMSPEAKAAQNAQISQILKTW